MNVHPFRVYFVVHRIIVEASQGFIAAGVIMQDRIASRLEQQTSRQFRETHQPTSRHQSVVAGGSCSPMHLSSNDSTTMQWGETMEEEKEEQAQHIMTHEEYQLHQLMTKGPEEEPSYVSYEVNLVGQYVAGEEQVQHLPEQDDDEDDGPRAWNHGEQFTVRVQLSTAGGKADCCRQNE